MPIFNLSCHLAIYLHKKYFLQNSQVNSGKIMFEDSQSLLSSTQYSSLRTTELDEFFSRIKYSMKLFWYFYFVTMHEVKTWMDLEFQTVFMVWKNWGGKKVYFHIDKTAFLLQWILAFSGSIAKVIFMLLNTVSSILTSIHSKNYILCYLLILCVYVCKHMRELKQYLILRDALTFSILFYFTVIFLFCSIVLKNAGHWHQWIVACSLEDIVQEELVNADILDALVVGDLIL